jgi:hypothetical protein
LCYFTVALAHHDDEVCCKSLLNKPKAPPPIQGFLNSLASDAIGVWVCCVHTGGWIDDQEDSLGMEDIRWEKRLFLVFGGSKSTEKEDRSERGEFAERHSGPPASRQVYASLHRLTRPFLGTEKCA